MLLRVLAAAVLAWTVFTRAWNISARPFWLDEAWVADTVRHSSYVHLLTQSEVPCPPLFAMAVKLLGHISTAPEVGFRALPMICGILIVPLIYCVARTLHAPRTLALAGMSLAASGLMLVIWSRELKQYEVEAFIATLLALLVFKLRRRAAPQTRPLLSVGIVSVSLLAPWLGYGSVFPASVLLVLLLILRPLGATRRALRATAVIALAALALSVGAVWHVSAARQSADEALIEFTSRWYIQPLELRSWLRAGAYGAASTTMMLVPTHWTRYAVVLGGLAAAMWGLVLVGLRAWPRRGRAELACWTVLPWLLLIGAAVARRYPFGAPRMMAFLAPPMMLALAAGMVGLCRIGSLIFASRAGPGMIAGLLLTLLPAIYVIRVPLHQCYWVMHDFPGLLRVLARERRDNEKVVVASGAVGAVRFYADRDSGFAYVPLAAGACLSSHYDVDAFVRDAFRTAGSRWWLLTTSDEREPVHRSLFDFGRQHGYQVDRIAGGDGALDPLCHVAQLYRVERPAPRQAGP
jgi:hypothetical protein